MYSMAATLRCDSDTSRVDTTLTCLSAGERQWVLRVSVRHAAGLRRC
ncbi:hypothetical protein I551_4437 [Mycobacterium ulcerans str. Harvey]|uniref:Uncharacterized protein n=1 Tax=Mycobacterium ulcerans str. Harvey TaxID=1299332 RepID=A0ABN0QWD4_MYCUL|nr:hypothetical protein I551_4437 [Mycobacterium ulcerans str. Harvey]